MEAMLKIVLAMLVAALVAARGLVKKSLSPSGAVAGFVVLSLSMASGIRFGALVLAFYLSSSFLTKYKSDEKRGVDDDFKEGGQRDWLQVLANSAGGTLLSLAVVYYTGWEDKCMDSKGDALVTGLLGGILGYYACCAGDTWSSEVGVLSKSQPRLITTMQVVPRGTNGGVTLLGTAAAAVGGAFIGLVYVLTGMLTTPCRGSTMLRQWEALPLGCLAGFIGSLMDSLLGATVQFSGMCKVRKKVVGKPGPTVKRITGEDFLSNNGVNFASALLTSLVTAAISLLVF
ncbi:hypothetical protein SELMODRAFT_186736 [Selaginella moellendorffii]|uniref:Transmembrane protein 19 n=1 Tax=Selaginella moellendorffii TaxID=88036 RepID=D8T9Z9_SELML|nr:protein PGR [Selaginella moellendorffii]XP_024521876.1 protein PGR [Selaginella moellendorffii]XP_024521877.1 protein PGR [Selaginella moellendorffii]EFJ06537.1 hypothetical protein SELMODRAFT_186736 [Selaginella moellendorffii]|eukprot:XP_002992387.1 protein PGR [Selaginella moellendorffii]